MNDAEKYLLFQAFIDTLNAKKALADKQTTPESATVQYQAIAGIESLFKGVETLLTSEQRRTVSLHIFRMKMRVSDRIISLYQPLI